MSSKHFGVPQLPPNKRICYFNDLKWLKRQLKIMNGNRYKLVWGSLDIICTKAIKVQHSAAQHCPVPPTSGVPSPTHKNKSGAFFLTPKPRERSGGERCNALACLWFLHSVKFLSVVCYVYGNRHNSWVAFRCCCCCSLRN